MSRAYKSHTETCHTYKQGRSHIRLWGMSQIGMMESCHPIRSKETPPGGVFYLLSPQIVAPNWLGMMISTYYVAPNWLGMMVSIYYVAPNWRSQVKRRKSTQDRTRVPTHFESDYPGREIDGCCGKPARLLPGLPPGTLYLRLYHIYMISNCRCITSILYPYGYSSSAYIPHLYYYQDACTSHLSTHTHTHISSMLYPYRYTI